MRYLALLATVLLVSSGCGLPLDHGDDDNDDNDDNDDGSDDDDDTGDDDTADDDDDDLTPDPLAPELSSFGISHSSQGNDCVVSVEWHADDPDGDMTNPLVTVAFDDIERQWTFELTGTPPILSFDFALDIEIGGPGQPQLEPSEPYDVGLWMEDDAGRESNHIGQDGWSAPGEGCQ